MVRETPLHCGQRATELLCILPTTLRASLAWPWPASTPKEPSQKQVGILLKGKTYLCDAMSRLSVLVGTGECEERCPIPTLIIFDNPGVWGAINEARVLIGASCSELAAFIVFKVVGIVARLVPRTRNKSAILKK